MNRILVSFLLSVLFALPSSGESVSFPYPQLPSRIKDQNRQISWFARHFWDEAGDVSIYDKSELEQAVVDYLTILQELPDSKRKAPVRRFIRKVSDMETVLPLIEKYLYDVDSPMRDDGLYAFLIGRMSFVGSRELLLQISANAPGSPAVDFRMEDKSGKSLYLYDLLSGEHQTLIFFYDDSCAHCREVISDVKSSAELAYLSALGVLKLVCVNISGESIPVSFPVYCADTRLSDEDFFTEGKYFFRSMPSFFLIGPDGKILLKETNFREALNYCAEKQNIKLH